MKLRQIIGISIAIILIAGIVIHAQKMHDVLWKTYTYRGVIVEKGKEDPTSGYKTSTDAKYY